MQMSCETLHSGLGAGSCTLRITFTPRRSTQSKVGRTARSRLPLSYTATHVYIEGQLGGGHPDIFRVSNDPDQGCWEPGGVGASGWHNDGAFMPNVYSHALYQIVAVDGQEGGQGSPTMFADLNSAVNSMSMDLDNGDESGMATVERWFRLTSGIGYRL